MPRTLSFLLLSALQVTTAWSQGSQSVSVTPETVGKQPFIFRVRTQANMNGLPKEDGFRFSIEVTERDHPIHPKSYGSLWIMSGEELLVRVDVAPKRDGKSLIYEFDLARRLLQKETSFSFVSIRTALNPVGQEFTLGDFYTFDLLQFTPK